MVITMVPILTLLYSTYKIESKVRNQGLYTDINGNKATSYGLIAAAEKAGLELYLGSYPITPATDILHELSKHKSLGVKNRTVRRRNCRMCFGSWRRFCRCSGSNYYFRTGCLSEK